MMGGGLVIPNIEHKARFSPDVALDNNLINRTLAVLSQIEEISEETTTPEAFRKYVLKFIAEERKFLTS